MATKYTLTTAFTAITETSGTIQNVGNESVELASSTNAVAGEGIVLHPGEKRSFKGALSARSIGDAGADVNVVDFIEAGEGGEEYDLPIASDTELGGIKISNSFTVANDGTLSIKKSGKTILGAVKSSDDEGKVSVNNDGTMTYNPLGYRQPSTTYAAGQIAYHASLPTGWYLECTTAGISGSGDLTISSPSIGGTVSDGTVTWTIRSLTNTVVTKSFVDDLNFPTMGNTYVDAPNSIVKYSPDTANAPAALAANNTYGTALTMGLARNGFSQFAIGLIDQGAPLVCVRNFNTNNNTWTEWKRVITEAGWNASAAMHNAIYRGNDLTSYWNSGQMSTDIQAGNFGNIYPGDYIIKSITIDGTTYSNVKFIIMDLDYHLHCGDAETTAHHVVIMPEEALGSAQMNTEHTTAGGYLGSKMWTEHMPKVTAGFEAAFGAAHILEHRELLSNAMDANAKSNAYDGWSGAASNWVWVSVKANLANENMVYGAPVLSSSFFDTGECNSQLAAFRLNHGLICSKRYWWWLRSVAYASNFCVVGGCGDASGGGAAFSDGVRPITLLH